MSVGICGGSRLVITNGISPLLMVKEYLDHDLLTKVFKIQKHLCAVLRAMIMVVAPLPLKGAHI